MKDFLILDIKRLEYLEMWVSASSIEEAEQKILAFLGTGFMPVPAEKVFPPNKG